MTGDAEYQAWVDSNATLPFPGGEDPQEFRDRACQGFLEGLELCAEDGIESAALSSMVALSWQCWNDSQIEKKPFMNGMWATEKDMKQKQIRLRGAMHQDSSRCCVC